MGNARCTGHRHFWPNDENDKYSCNPLAPLRYVTYVSGYSRRYKLTIEFNIDIRDEKNDRYYARTCPLNVHNEQYAM